MSQENVNIVRRMYDAFAKGDIATIIAALDPQVEWWEAENFIYADKNPYVGPDAVMEGVFVRIVHEWDGFEVSPKEVLDGGETAIGHGIIAAPTRKTARPSARSSPTSSLSAMEKWRSSSSTQTPRSS